MLKKRLKKYIQNFGKLFVFSFGFLGLFGLIALLGGWTTNSEGNLVSDNLYSGQRDIYYNDYDSDSQIGTQVTTIEFNEFQLTENDNIQSLYLIFNIPLEVVNEKGSNGYEGFDVEIGFQNILGNSILYVSNYEDYDVVLYDYDNDLIIYIFEYDKNQHEGETINYIKFTSLGDYLNIKDIMLSYNMLSQYEPYNKVYYSENIAKQVYDLGNYQLTYGYLDSNEVYHSNGNITNTLREHITESGLLKCKEIYEDYILYDDNNSCYNFTTDIDLNVLNNNLIFTPTQQTDNIVLYITLKYNDIVYNKKYYPLQNFYDTSFNLYDLIKLDSSFTNIDTSVISFNSFTIYYLTNDNFLSSISLYPNNQYNLGYQKGFLAQEQNINNYKIIVMNNYNRINELTHTIELLQLTIQNQSEIINGQGWRSLFFAMADTPLRTVSNVLGFELFGLNLFQAFIGALTVLAIVWLIRKLWK